MVYFPNAKINLGLQVLEKGKDGFHQIASCFYPVPWHDVLEIIEAKKLIFSSTGIDIPGKLEDNLCLKAYKLLNKDYQLPPVHIHLHKIIPIGGGLGGGSADAAFTLKALSQMFHLFLQNDILEMYAAQIGSDCPFFIAHKPAFAQVRGGELSAIKLQLAGKYLVLVYPPIHVGTAEAYAGVMPSPANYDLQEVLENDPVSAWKPQVKNDFENSIFQKYPAIEAVKTQLYNKGASYASMTGSGATVYGIFEEELEVADAFPADYIIWKGFLM